MAVSTPGAVPPAGPIQALGCQSGSRPVQAMKARESVAPEGAGFSAAKTRDCVRPAGMGTRTLRANSTASAGSAMSRAALLPTSQA